MLVVCRIFSAFLFILISCNIGYAQDVKSIIDKISSELSKSCVPPLVDVSNLVGSLSLAEEGRADAIRGLRFLAGLPFWKGVRKGTDWKAIVELSSSDSRALQFYTARAMVVADGELISAVFNENLERTEELKKLNLDVNRYYPFISNFAILQFYLWKIDDAIQSKDSETIKNTSFSAILLIDEIIELLVEQPDESLGALPGLLNDIYLLKIVLTSMIGESDWRYEIANFASEQYTESAFDANGGINHISINFLRPSYIISEFLFKKRTFCQDTRDRLAQNRFWITASLVKERLLNPIVLSDEICRILSENQGDILIEQLATSIGKVRNRDYRVIIGHFEGEEVRYSFNSRSELLSLANEIASDDFVKTLDAGSAAKQSCLGEEILELVNPNIHAGEHSRSNVSKGYIFIGDGLSYEVAEKLRDYISSEYGLEEAYLFRPRFTE